MPERDETRTRRARRLHRRRIDDMPTRSSAAASPTRRRHGRAVALHPRRSGGPGSTAARCVARQTPRFRPFSCRSIPTPPVWLRPLTRVKYLRTLVTQLIYLPSLVPRVAARRRRPRVLGVVLVVPARAAAGGNCCAPPRPARPHQLSQRRGAGSSSPLGDRPERRCDRSTGTSCRRVSSSRSSPSTRSRRRSSRTSSTASGSASGCAIRCGRGCSPLATSNRSTTWRARCERLAPFSAATPTQR